MISTFLSWRSFFIKIIFLTDFVTDPNHKIKTKNFKPSNNFII